MVLHSGIRTMKRLDSHWYETSREEMKRIRTICVVPAIILACLLAAPAHSMTLTWTLENAVFTDGTSLTGSWKYDADDGTYTDLSAMTMQLLPFEGASYTMAGFVSGDAGWFQATSPSPTSGTYTLDIYLEDDMTNSGGVIQIQLALEELNDQGVYTSRTGRAGLVSAPVQLAEPATLGLLVFGLAGISLVRRRRAT
jgi:hypothetical protein